MALSDQPLTTIQQDFVVIRLTLENTSIGRQVLIFLARLPLDAFTRWLRLDS